MFHDGRVTVNPDHPAGFDSPAGDDLLPGLDHSLAVQAMFPPTSGTEMAGQPSDLGENEIADPAADGDVLEFWRLLTKRGTSIQEYRNLIIDAYPDITQDNLDNNVTFAHIANAIGAFEATAFRADNSPFDRYLRGEKSLSKTSVFPYQLRP